MNVCVCVCTSAHFRYLSVTSHVNLPFHVSCHSVYGNSCFAFSVLSSSIHPFIKVCFSIYIISHTLAYLLLCLTLTFHEELRDNLNSTCNFQLFSVIDTVFQVESYHCYTTRQLKLPHSMKSIPFKTRFRLIYNFYCVCLINHIMHVSL